MKDKSVLLSFYPSILVSFYPSILLSFYPSILVSLYPSILLSLYPCILLSLYPSILVSFYPSILLNVYLCVLLVYLVKVCKYVCRGAGTNIIYLFVLLVNPLPYPLIFIHHPSSNIHNNNNINMKNNICKYVTYLQNTCTYMYKEIISSCRG